MAPTRTPVKFRATTRLLTAAEFQALADMPAEAEWFKNIRNTRTRRAYEHAIKDFMLFAGIQRPEEFRKVTRAHVIAWRDELGDRILPDGHTLDGATIRHRLAALSSLFNYLCDKNAVTHNPVRGVKRPKNESDEGKTPALGDRQARKLLAAPDAKSQKGIRDRAILTILLYHALRREELCKLRVKDYKHERSGVAHLKVSGKGEKTRYVALHEAAEELIDEYLNKAGHGEDRDGPLFRRVFRAHRRPASPGVLPARAPRKPLTADGVYRLVRKYSEAVGKKVGAHALRATAATNALDNNADIAKVQEWLGHANISTTRIYDHRKTRPEDSPTFKVSY